MEFDTKREIWIVRAGEGAAYSEEFLEEKLVAIGWAQAGPIEKDTPDEKIDELFQRAYSTHKPNAVRVWASQVKRFVREPVQGDPVATYDRDRRRYLLGVIQGPAQWREERPLTRWRPVKWLRETPRDVLSASARNSLGAIATLFRLSEAVTSELWEKAVPLGSEERPKVEVPRVEPAEEDEEIQVIQDFEERARQFVEDRLARLDWEQMQSLVASVLRAMGYKTRISEKGSDRSIDIFASPDGLGLQEPRIFVEVKHRLGTPMGAPEVRTFLGGRKPGDRCLYVSTGGFSREARYEAERASVPIALLTMADLRELLLDHYDRIDEEGRSFVPLKRVYWPAE